MPVPVQPLASVTAEVEACSVPGDLQLCTAHIMPYCNTTEPGGSGSIQGHVSLNILMLAVSVMVTACAEACL